MADKFFNEGKEEEESETEPSKIKLGETEFTEDELTDLVGKAKKIKEFEEKQGQSWDEVAKSWGKRGERIGTLKKELEEVKSKLDSIPKTEEQLTKEERETKIRQELNRFGVVTKEELENYYKEQRGKERVVSRTNKVIRQAKRDGYPETTPEQLIKFMADPANPNNPEVAYKIMFEKEIDRIKSEKLESLRKKGMTTTTKNNAGAKDFTPQKITKENLRSTLKEHFSQNRE